MNKSIICPCCNEEVEVAVFCSNCGYKLESKKTESIIEPKVDGFPNTGNMISPLLNRHNTKQVTNVSKNTTIDDKDLKLLVDCCKKVLATALGDSYTEVVLYLDEKTDSYQIHTYSKEFTGETTHYGYTTTKEYADTVLSSIKEYNLIRWKNASAVPMTGADYVIKFRDDSDNIVRLSMANFGAEGMNEVRKISDMLYNGISKENILR